METTYAVELTPSGRAAVAVVLVSGPRALTAVKSCFHPVSSRLIEELPIGRIALGRWGGVDGEELIVCPRAGDTIEVHCHGGTAAVAGVIDRLVARGCQQISWKEWLRLDRRDTTKIELASPRDAITRAAHIALAEAPTARTAMILLDQYEGALSRSIASVIDAIGDADWTRASLLLNELLQFRDLGLHLTMPWRVVLAGAPNVGKSSLINALAGYQRAIVSPQSGTTRDVVTTTTAIAGWPVQLADTAGLRDTSDTLESAGVALATDASMAADLVLLVEDVSRRDAHPANHDRKVGRIMGELPSHVRVIRVRNKIDLLEAKALRETGRADGFAISAITGEGVATLISTIAATLVPVEPEVGAGVPFTAAQIGGLESAQAAIERTDGLAAKCALHALLANDAG